MTGKELKEIVSQIDDDTLICVDGLEVVGVRRVESYIGLKNIGSSETEVNLPRYHTDQLIFNADAYRGGLLNGNT